MTGTEKVENLPAQISAAVLGIPKALVPTCLKALDRLIGAAIDVPVAWLGQQKAKIEAQTEAYSLVESAIGKAAASLAESDPDTVQRAAEVLIRKAYRKQVNIESVASAMLEDLRSTDDEGPNEPGASKQPVDDDWLNVFERFAEDASTDRMQQLWGRVLAGEIRTPGRFAMRTLRFLSEFSQAEALSFAEFANSAFGDAAPNKLVKPEGMDDIKNLIYLESAGVISGASGLGLSRTINFSNAGFTNLREGKLIILLKGAPNLKIDHEVCALTPLGQELLHLIPGRDPKIAARRVAEAIRCPQILEAYIGKTGATGTFVPMEVVWQQGGSVVQG